MTVSGHSSAARAESRGPLRTTYTTQSFSIVPENLVRVARIAGPRDGVTTLTVVVTPCADPRGEPARTVLVIGAPAGTFGRGEIVATGGLFRDGAPIAAIRKVGRSERRSLHC